MTRTQLASLAAIALILFTVAWRYQDMPMVRCEWCKTPGTLLNRLERHHEKPRERYPELANEPSNIVVLHRNCQIVLGHRNNTHTFNPDIREIINKYTNELPNVAEGSK